jgi:outer membrane protein
MMKKNILYACILMALAVAGLTNCKSKTEGTPTKSTNEDVANIKLSSSFSAAWVNIDSLVSNYYMYFDKQKELEESSRKSEATINGKSRDFEAQVKDYQEKVQKGLLTTSQAQQIEQKLGEQQQELYRLRDELRAQLANEQQEKLAQIHKSITDYLATYNKDKGFHLILSSTFGGPLLYGHPALDITQEVLKGINQKYSSEHNTSAKK